MKTVQPFECLLLKLIVLVLQPTTVVVHQSHFHQQQQEAAVFSKQPLINPLYTTYPVPNSRHNTVERITAKEPDIFHRSWQRPKQNQTD